MERDRDDRPWWEQLIVDKMRCRAIEAVDIVDRRLRYPMARGMGTFHCGGCKNSWSSYWVWVKFDLRLQQIRKTFKQKCKKCDRTLWPAIREDKLEEMLEFVLKRFSEEKQPMRGEPGVPKVENRPHQASLCERCGFSAETPCWISKFKLDIKN